MGHNSAHSEGQAGQGAGPWGCVLTPNCATTLHDNARLRITSLPVGRINTVTAFTNNDAVSDAEGGQKPEWTSLQGKEKTKWNQRSLELRVVSIIQGDPFVSAPLLHVAPKPTHQ